MLPAEMDVVCVTWVTVLLSTWISLEARETPAKTDTSRVLRTCNVTYSDNFLYEPVTLTLPDFDITQDDRPIYCLYAFAGTESHRISIHVTELHAGYFNTSGQACENGYLKVWDGYREPGRHRYTPNTLCGYHDDGDISVHKVSTGRYAEVEFYASDFTRLPSFKFTASYLKAAQDVNLQSKQLHHSMTPATNASSVCEWDQDIEKCDYECPILSPGYPGLYPPNSKCSYHVFSRNPYVTFKLKASGFTENRKLRGFKLRRECTEDYVDVFDTPSIGDKSRHVGRFCGMNFPNITTSSNSIFLVFSSGLDTPPYNYSGFHIGVTAVTKEWHQDGVQIPESLCNWVFNATVGSVSSPEHWLPRKTTCEYGFNVNEGNYLKFILNIYGLRPHCADYIHVMDGDRVLAKLCDQNVQETKETFIFNITSVFAKIRYFTSGGQMEGQEAKGFWLSFRQIADPTPRGIPVTDKPTDKAQPVIRYAFDDSKASVQYPPFATLAFLIMLGLLTTRCKCTLCEL